MNREKTVHYKQAFRGGESEHDYEYDFLVKSFENEDESAIQKPGKWNRQDMPKNLNI